MPSGIADVMTCWTAGGRPLPSSPSPSPVSATLTPLWVPPSPGVPQTSQYPSTTWPAHPGWVQAGAAVVVLIGFPHGS